MDLSDSFFILIYPFYHNVPHLNKEKLIDKVGRHFRFPSLNRKDYEALARLNSGWQFWMSRLSKEERNLAFDNTYFFLPYVRALLFPETSSITTNPLPKMSDGMEDWTGLQVEQIALRTAEHATIRLTYKPQWLEEIKMVELVTKDFTSLLEICWIDLFLFPQRIGFLLLKIKQRDENLEAGRLTRILNHIRRVHRPFMEYEEPIWHFPCKNNPVHVDSAGLINCLLQGLVEEPQAEKELLSPNEFLHSPHKESSNVYTESPLGQTYGEVFHTYSYACVKRKPGEHYVDDESISSESLFSSPTQRSLYEMATYSRTDELSFRPAKQQLQNLFDTGLISFWDNWQAMALKYSVVFLANYEDEFTKIYLPRNIESDYLPLYLFVLYQETRLSIMFGALMETEKNTSANLKRARELWEMFLKFQNHYWFTEVTHKPQGMELYRIFQQALGVQHLYEKQNEEVQVLREFYENKIQRQTNRMINFLTFVGVPVGILSQMYGSALITKASWWDPILIMAITMAILLALWYLVFREK